MGSYCNHCNHTQGGGLCGGRQEGKLEGMQEKIKERWNTMRLCEVRGVLYSVSEGSNQRAQHAPQEAQAGADSASIDRVNLIHQGFQAHSTSSFSALQSLKC